ncbi:hypothetical protein OHV05_35690 (plasmid) [Kitasatospora sp. NBC_00070]|uniref:hypothetical protein n=1 Tax=Kitasatospora sp. NBC_00070 TaxID=2975962 RepID=UPI002F90E5EB
MAELPAGSGRLPHGGYLTELVNGLEDLGAAPRVWWLEGQESPGADPVLAAVLEWAPGSHSARCPTSDRRSLTVRWHSIRGWSYEWTLGTGPGAITATTALAGPVIGDPIAVAEALVNVMDGGAPQEPPPDRWPDARALEADMRLWHTRR